MTRRSEHSYAMQPRSDAPLQSGSLLCTAAGTSSHLTLRWREPDSNHRSRLQKRAVDTRQFLVRFPFSLWHFGFVSETVPTPPITRNQVELMAKDNRAGRRSSRPLPQAACVRGEHRAIAGGGARCRLVGLRQGGFEQVIPASEPLSLRLSLVAVLAASLGLWALIWWTL